MQMPTATLRTIQRATRFAVISRIAYTCKVPIRLERVKHNFCPAADPGVAATLLQNQPRRDSLATPLPSNPVGRTLRGPD
jgi:hypothetical protein